MLAGRLLVSIAVLALLGAGSATSAERRVHKELLYKLEVNAVSSAGVQRSTEWVGAFSGFWRIEEGDDVHLYTAGPGGDRTYAAYRPGAGFSVRTGSERFLGSLADRSLTRAAVRAYAEGKASANGIEVRETPEGRTELRFRTRGYDVVATIVERAGLPGASSLDLFTIPESEVWSLDEERVPGGSPSDGRAYWFGMKLGSRKLVTVVEHVQKRPTKKAEFRLFYELGAARGRSSAFFGETAPPGEVVVLNEPRSAGAMRANVTLASGIKAQVSRRGSGFQVLTRRTAVTVTGPFGNARLAQLARRLKPLP